MAVNNSLLQAGFVFLWLVDSKHGRISQVKTQLL